MRAITEAHAATSTLISRAKISVPTLDGVAKVTVRPGTQNGTLLRMRGMGLPSLSGASRGDELIKVLVEVPKKLTRDQMKLLRDFDGQLPATAHPSARSSGSYWGSSVAPIKRFSTQTVHTSRNHVVHAFCLKEVRLFAKSL